MGEWDTDDMDCQGLLNHRAGMRGSGDGERCHFAGYNVPPIRAKSVPGVFTNNVPPVRANHVPGVFTHDVPPSDAANWIILPAIL